ncbi:MAG: MarR family transcriptional regulator [Microscillaceae bacterium]|jgi:DNA-binding MarR family transcriptional regulator|nr:MarR family transcriptional regulator [Microscillaceae bacterium]
MKREESVDYQIKAAWHAIARMYNSEANKFDLTVSVGYILLNIDLDEGTPATKIAPLLGLEARSITRTLKNMEEEGFIYKVQDEKDRRFFRIFLTEKGKKAREVSRLSVIRFNAAVYDEVSEDKMKVFFEVMQKIHQIIDNQTNHVELKTLVDVED